ncbi:MAG: YedE-related selenium metabolism membrane protein [Desulfuromonas sp.]|nr:MAG: YedE-related selenium metabolism membrane protein [Desulfuromonas sp.]
MPTLDRHFWLVIVASLALGIAGVGLAVAGNPENSGICISCFLENSAGALGLHDNARMQYLRPEIIGFVLGAVLSAGLFREFNSRGGSAPLVRLLAGIFLMIGCGVFIGCPIKLFLRLTAGDLTSLAGLAGLVAGVWIGLRGLAAGIHFGRAEKQRGSGWWIPCLGVALLLFYLFRPGFLLFSTSGSAAQHAPMLLSLGAGLLLGMLAQRSRFCITGSIRDSFLMRGRTPLLWGLLVFVVVAVGFNLFSGQFRLGMYGQPGAHLQHFWSFAGMALVGWLSVLIGGCPFRQLIKAGEGDADAGLVVIGMVIGGGLVQAWGLTATAAGVPFYGKVATLVGFLFLLTNSLLWRDRTS